MNIGGYVMYEQAIVYDLPGKILINNKKIIQEAIDNTGATVSISELGNHVGKNKKFPDTIT